MAVYGIFGLQPKMPPSINGISTNASAEIPVGFFFICSQFLCHIRLFNDAHSPSPLLFILCHFLIAPSNAAVFSFPFTISCFGAVLLRRLHRRKFQRTRLVRLAAESYYFLMRQKFFPRHPSLPHQSQQQKQSKTQFVKDILRAFCRFSSLFQQQILARAVLIFRNWIKRLCGDTLRGLMRHEERQNTTANKKPNKFVAKYLVREKGEKLFKIPLASANLQ